MVIFYNYTPPPPFHFIMFFFFASTLIIIFMILLCYICHLLSFQALVLITDHYPFHINIFIFNLQNLIECDHYNYSSVNFYISYMYLNLSYVFTFSTLIITTIFKSINNKLFLKNIVIQNTILSMFPQIPPKSK